MCVHGLKILFRLKICINKHKISIVSEGEKKIGASGQEMCFFTNLLINFYLMMANRLICTGEAIRTILPITI